MKGNLTKRPSSNNLAHYALEDQHEFLRLEEQGRVVGYECEAEITSESVPIGAFILDAGCGSGIVSRFLATSYPEAQIIGYDLSEDRVSQATTVSQQYPNLY